MIACSASEICEACVPKCCTTEVFLTQYDINRITKKTGLYEGYFVTKKRGHKQFINLMLMKDGSCLFFDRVTKKCKIYDCRPLDCQLFPLDIDIQNGTYFWIFYIHCDYKNVPVQKALRFAKSEILPLLEADIEEYAEFEMKLYNQKKWFKIAKVIK